jgi:two-component sensor histidine kinase
MTSAQWPIFVRASAADNPLPRGNCAVWEGAASSRSSATCQKWLPRNSITSLRAASVALTALGRAHDLVRPIPGHEGKAALLGDLLTVLLAPYDDMGAFSGRVRVSVPRMGVGEASATTLAMVVHELATNSLKYGALSAATGTLDVSCALPDSDVVLVWTERGGPPVTAPSDAGGFGSKLVRRSMTAQLGGSIERQWLEDGVVVTIHMSKERLAR